MAADEPAADSADGATPGSHAHAKEVDIESLPFAEAIDYIHGERAAAQKEADKALVLRDKHQRSYDRAMAEVHHLDHMEESLLLRATDYSASATDDQSVGAPASPPAHVLPTNPQLEAEKEGVVPAVAATPQPSNRTATPPSHKTEASRRTQSWDDKAGTWLQTHFPKLFPSDNPSSN